MLSGYSRALTAQLFVAALLAAGVSAAASAKTKLVYSTYLTANHVINTKAMKPFFGGVAKATDGGLTFDLVAGGSLFGTRTTLNAIKNGLVVLRLIITVYKAGELQNGRCSGGGTEVKYGVTSRATVPQNKTQL